MLHLQCSLSFCLYIPLMRYADMDDCVAQITMPDWLRGDVIDVRKEVIFWSEGKPSGFRRMPRVSVSR